MCEKLNVLAMKKNLLCFLVCIYAVIIVLSMMSIAYADIPSNVKEEYEYNDHDSSIIIVKNRLKELGYFGKNAQFSDVVSNELKTAVKAFQKKNNVLVNGVIDKAFLELLFSDDAAEKDGKPKVRAVVLMEEPAVTESETTSLSRIIEDGAIKEKNKDEDKSAIDLGWAFVIICICFIFGGVLLSKTRKKALNQYKIESLNSQSQKNVKMTSVSDVKTDSVAYKHGISIGQESRAESKSEQWNKVLQKVAEQKKEKYLQQKAEDQQRQVVFLAQQERIRKQKEEEEKDRQEVARRNQQVINTIKLHSTKYNQMMQTIKKYGFIDNVSLEYNLSYVFSNRYCFDTVKPIDALAYLASNNEHLKKGYEIIKDNRKKQRQYLDEISKCKETPDFDIRQTGIEHTRFLHIENNLCKSIEPKIKTDLEVTMYLYYRNGGAHALHTYTFHYNEINFAYSINPVPDIEYVGAQEEREKVTPKLRYQIMKRDHFRCVICGASAEEGARLHVDHIQPVSKGGKTVESNLRTLCDRCNLGKSDQYDPNGLN